MKKPLRNKALYLAVALVMMLTAAAAMAVPANAAGTSAPDQYVTVEKHPAYNQNGIFYMSFTMTNKLYRSTATHSAKLFDQTGKQICYWEAKNLDAFTSYKRNFGTKFSTLPAGVYFFKLFITLSGQTSTRSYTITHNVKPSIAFKSHETFYDKNGYYMHKFNMQYTCLKDQTARIKIYDAQGNLVYSMQGSVKRKSNYEAGWFTWSGYTNGKKYPSGNYTVIVTSGGQMVEKTFKLNLLEAGR